MRNLLEYPITADEVLVTLTQASQTFGNPGDADDIAIGGPQDFIFEKTRDFLACHPEIMAQLLESMSVKTA